MKKQNIAIILFCMLVVMPATYLVADRDAQVTLGFGQVAPAIVRPGEEAELQREIVWGERECDGYINRWIFDSTTTLRTQVVPLEDHAVFQVPVAMANGQARIREEWVMRCNPLHEVIWPIRILAPDVMFQVSIPPPMKAARAAKAQATPKTRVPTRRRIVQRSWWHWW